VRLGHENAVSARARAHREQGPQGSTNITSYATGTLDRAPCAPQRGVAAGENRRHALVDTRLRFARDVTHSPRLLIASWLQSHRRLLSRPVRSPGHRAERATVPGDRLQSRRRSGSGDWGAQSGDSGRARIDPGVLATPMTELTKLAPALGRRRPPKTIDVPDDGTQSSSASCDPSVGAARRS